MKFHLGDLLSITDGRLLSPDRIDGVYKILNFMTGDSLMTNPLPLAADAVRPDLLHQHPWLAEVQAPPKGVATEELMAWFDGAVAAYGEYHDVAPAPLSWGQHDPIQDFRNEYPDKPLIVVSATAGGVVDVENVAGLIVAQERSRAVVADVLHLVAHKGIDAETVSAVIRAIWDSGRAIVDQGGSHADGC